MQYCVGDKIISRKNHACGGNEWTVTRIGADVKLKCNKCGRAIFLSVDETDRMKKQLISNGQKENDV